MSAGDASERAACPLCGARIPYRRRFKEFWSTHPGEPVLLLCGGCGRYVQDRRHVYWWRVPQWLLISLRCG